MSVLPSPLFNFNKTYFLDRSTASRNNRPMSLRTYFLNLLLSIHSLPLTIIIKQRAFSSLFSNWLNTIGRPWNQILRILTFYTWVSVGSIKVIGDDLLAAFNPKTTVADPLDLFVAISTSFQGPDCKFLSRSNNYFVATFIQTYWSFIKVYHLTKLLRGVIILEMTFALSSTIELSWIKS